nr:PREDICTED: tRNA (cytosine(34)-C(5))-methyltransferase, mitochondrial-like [Paralichthys olivaceus]
MFVLHQVHSVWRTSSFTAEKLTLCFCRCHTTQRGAANTQLIKKHKKERSSCQPVLDLFDQQYSQELGELWASTRSALLDPQSWQYGVLLNRFTAVTDVTQILQSQGFSRFLPQTDVSSPLSNSKNQTGKDSSPQCVSASPALSQDIRSNPSVTLPHPSLQCYIHAHPLRFPSQPHRHGQLKQYYLLNAASLLPVLALQVRDGDKVLDLCSAPGGKALAILQCATPGKTKWN